MIADHVLARKEPYQDCGANNVTSRDRRRGQRRLVRRLEQLGDQVSLRPASTATVVIFSEPYLSHPCDLPPPRGAHVDATQPRHRVDTPSSSIPVIQALLQITRVVEQL
jgi:hypothetical protein